MDSRIRNFTPWQRIVYDLCWKAGTSKSKAAADELERMKAERPEEYEKALVVWSEICLEVLN